MGKVSSFLLGSLVGSAIGAAAAVLMAPTSGDELRHQLTDRAQTLQTEVKNAAAARRAELEQQLAMLKAPRK
jgi:gas vesicle protein